MPQSWQNFAEGRLSWLQCGHFMARASVIQRRLANAICDAVGAAIQRWIPAFAGMTGPMSSRQAGIQAWILSAE
jgi:hypothetical protein